MKKTLGQARKLAKLTQKEVADKIGVLPETVSKWESCKSIIAIPNFIVLCKLYSCTVDDIFLPLY